MSELPFGVIVCNTAGTILLYNRKAQEMFHHEAKNGSDGAALGGTLGLGRSVFGLLEREPIVHTGLGKLDQELGDPFYQDLHHPPAFFGRGLVRVARAAVGGQ